MNIVVTLPKGERLVKSQYRGQPAVFWTISKKPSDLNINDRVYFVDGDAISYYHPFIGFAQDPMCETTGRVYAGLTLILGADGIPLKTPFPFQGFRGFHYFHKDLS